MWRGGRRDGKPSVSGFRHKIRQSRLESGPRALLRHLVGAEQLISDFFLPTRPTNFLARPLL